MKNLSQITFILLLALVTACQKDEPVPSDSPPCVIQKSPNPQDSIFFYDNYKGRQELGWAKAFKIYREWEATAWASLVDGEIALAIYTYLDEKNPHYSVEFLSFENIEPQKGCFALKNIASGSSASAYYATLQFDALEDRYLVYEDSNDSYLQIDSVDLNQEFVKGQFMVTFVKDTSWITDKPYNPDTVRFFNGSFECRFKN